MPHSFGYRARTRHMFARDFRKKGQIALSTYLKSYKVGDIVDIKANGAIHKGMPHKFYHGRTGVVYNVTKSAVGVIVNKRVGNRYIEKRVNLRIEHVRHSKCRDDFVRRVKENAAAKAAAKAAGQKICLKRKPAQPREARFVSGNHGKPTTVAPVPYESK
ncbi:60S ribosomal protein L21-A [Syncephalis pseudoplumigaleata]|uniref:60S ribosomal protein L21-A n=1 Tax=Syncephalis pseudoplumigaleata TaxID=1712513 RepID=A0A4P9Z3R8_9FUNG|nr:60S ribosomal protein L21-A [Syncephalis pseudoplumigaleata]|eukprot:RKP27038.1 60S ribosomal protein L21-A [Syncephalis pseudoplumigaleata]